MLTKMPDVPDRTPNLPLSLQVPNWSSLGRFKRSRFPSLGGGGQQFGGGAGAGALSGACFPCPRNALLRMRKLCCPIWLCHQNQSKCCTFASLSTQPLSANTPLLPPP
jgi:hypothetical protein